MLFLIKRLIAASIHINSSKGDSRKPLFQTVIPQQEKRCLSVAPVAFPGYG